MIAKPATPEAVELLHRGAVALAQVERAGIRVDEAYLDATLEQVGGQLKALEAELRQDEVWTVWRKRYRGANLDSLPQLTEVLFSPKLLGHPYPEGAEFRTATGRYRSDESALATVDLPFVQTYLRKRKLDKLHGTYLKGIKREVVGGFLHPVYNLNTARTYRSCVAKGTLVEIVRDVSQYPKGVPIEDVKEGDYAYCYDKNRRLTIRKVLWAGKTGSRRVVRLHWSARGKKGYLDLTPEHRVRIASGEYVRADCLEGRDLRGLGESKHLPKVRTLAMGRIGDALYETGNPEPLRDHRLIYETLVGPLEAYHVIHHRDGNHLNNQTGNLQRMTKSQHAKHHAPECLTEAARRKGLKAKQRNHRLYGGRWPSGDKCHNWINLTKYALLKILAKAGGRSARTELGFDVIRVKAKLLGVGLKVVKDRYDKDGRYISRGRLLRAFGGAKVRQVVQSFGINYQKAVRMLTQRGFVFLPLGPCRNPHGRGGLPHNHKITKVEYPNEVVDVYDIEVEEHHNFIANEICVHNSGSDPNFQNIPIRNPEIGKLVRSAFRARPGRRLVENDFGGIEVKVAACYNKDPNLIRYVTDPATDMHRDTAMELFCLTKEQVDKRTTRDWAKNRFVFPQFYGSVYFQCAPSLWEGVASGAAKVNGVSLRKHLREHGITALGACRPKEDPRPGTFEAHVRKVERSFWDDRFRVYSEWKRRWYAQYLERGWLRMHTGFVCEGVFGRNDVINYPVQGSAFHCLLACLIEMVLVRLRKLRMKTRVVGQIHDCVLADVPDNEVQDYLDLVTEVMTEWLPKRWPWLIVPLTAEAEVTPVSGTWHEKELWVKTNGTWGPKGKG